MKTENKNTFPEKITTSNDLAKVIVTALCEGYTDEKQDVVNKITEMIDKFVFKKVCEILAEME